MSINACLYNAAGRMQLYMHDCKHIVSIKQSKLQSLASLGTQLLVLLLRCAELDTPNKWCCVLGSAWHKDYTACAGAGLCDNGWSPRQAASQHPGGPPADLWLLVCNMEAGECLFFVQTHNLSLRVTMPVNHSVGVMTIP